MKIKYKQSDGSSLNKFHYQFNIHNLLNKLNFIIPKKFIIYLMEKNYTDFDSEINIGNIENNNLNEIWRGNKLKKYRDDWKNNKLPEVCKDCDRFNFIDSYIKFNALSIIIKHAKRFSRKILSN